MAIKNFPNKAAYDAAAKPTIESQVSMIETTREIIVDGVNAITTEPAAGDVVFLNEANAIVYIKGGSWIQKANIPSAWTHVGYVVNRKGRKVLIIDKNGTDEKYADVVQFKLNDPTLDGAEHTASIGVRVSTNYDANTIISYTYTATALSQVVTALNAAIDAAKTSGGWTNVLWAYLADANGNKVDADADATQIIVQLDTWDNNQQYNCSGMTHITWGDMPANTTYWKVNGSYSEYRGLMNLARGVAYWSTNGRTPSANVALPESGNTDPLNRSAFEASEYCAAVRAKYATYEDYLRGEFMVMHPQKYGSFALPGGEELTTKYGPMMAPTKAGSTKAKFPAMNKAYIVNYNNEALMIGKWFLPGCLEGCELMNDETLAIIAPSITKMGTTAINNSTNRWFAQRCNVGSARFFNGNDGILTYGNVNNRYRAQAVALLNI